MNVMIAHARAYVHVCSRSRAPVSAIFACRVCVCTVPWAREYNSLVFCEVPRASVNLLVICTVNTYNVQRHVYCCQFTYSMQKLKCLPTDFLPGMVKRHRCPLLVGGWPVGSNLSA